ncbi:MAG TPA: YqgE/AlgH family protein [Caulobacteraceae bacterium]|jgi:putative transcriptional regulator
MSASVEPGLSPPAEFLGGRILIAMPGIDDERFDRTVLLVCQHTEELAMGITLNQPVEGLSLPELLQRLGVKSGARAAPEPVLLGGPVERERGHVLHTDDYASPGSTMTVAEGVALTATREVLDALSDEIRRPRRAVLALGYAGWGAGQLEREIQESVWLICEPDEELLFGRNHEAKWAHALAKIGVSASQLSTQAGRA